MHTTTLILIKSKDGNVMLTTVDTRKICMFIIIVERHAILLRGRMAEEHELSHVFFEFDSMQVVSMIKRMMIFCPWRMHW